MRLWHKDLISYLPRQQLLGQWRECCAIAKSIREKGTTNHMLVNRVMRYPLEHFIHYCCVVYGECVVRGYRVNWDRIDDYFYDPIDPLAEAGRYVDTFPYWHNDRYLMQCYYNLQEKYDCGGISRENWQMIDSFVASQVG